MGGQTQMRKLSEEQIRRIVQTGCFAIAADVDVQAMLPEHLIERPDPDCPSMPIYRFAWDFESLAYKPHLLPRHRADVPAILVARAVEKLAGVDTKLTERYYRRWGFKGACGANRLLETFAGPITVEGDPCPWRVAFSWTFDKRSVTTSVPEVLVLLAMRGCAGPDWNKDPRYEYGVGLVPS